VTARTDNRVTIDAPIQFTWDVTNDVPAWPTLFTEYAAAEVLEEEPGRVVFRLTMHPDEQGNVWSWVSERILDRAGWSVTARRIETGPFQYMKLRWDYTELSPQRTELRWRQEFAMRPEAPIDDAAMAERLNRSSVVQMAAVRDGVHARRRRVIGRVDVPSNTRRGGDLRTLLSPGTVGSTSGFCGAVSLAPAEIITEHYHPYSEEFLYVSRGVLRVELDGEPHVVGPDQAVFVPIGVRHRLVNEGTEDAVAVFSLSPLAPSPELGHVDTETLADASRGVLAGRPE
jgi:quercetin dioxygenase-like cupin family protein/ribosome-associated toxin RatA of RatAB toxin-antitoxin module